MEIVDIEVFEYAGNPEYSIAEVCEALKAFFEERKEEVFFARQLHVLFENIYFHWLTHWGLQELDGLGIVRSEERVLKTGSYIKLYWHKSFRYSRRAAQRVVSLVEEYADPNIGAALGLQGEAMALEGFASLRFVLEGRETNEYHGTVWSETDHNLDFIFSRDGATYGVEVKNSLAYIDKREFDIKVKLCEALGVTPVFVVRMLPKTWAWELIQRGGFALVLKYQLYPWAHRELAKRVANELGLPVDAPRRLEEATMKRFLNWHLAKIR
jgi:hypothetical protein